MILDRVQKIFAGSVEDPNVPLGWEAISHAIESRGGGPSDAGIIISEDTAMRFGAVFACVRVIGGTIGSLPLEVFQRTKSGNGKTDARTNRAYPILHNRPNPQMSSMVWREAVQANTLLTGAGYSEIQYDNAGRIVNVWPLRSLLTSPQRDEKGFRFVTYDTPNSQARTIQPDDMLYVPGLSFNGVSGLSVIGYARNSIGLGLAAEKFGAKFFSNGARLSGVLSYPQRLSEKGRENLKHSFDEKYQGADNAHKTIVLEEGAKYTPLSVPPEDAQFIETRKHQRSEICGWFGVPPHLIGDLENATFSNIEQQDLEFAKHCMRTWLVRWEQELDWKLFRGTDFFCKFNLDDLLRGDFLSRQLGYQIQRQNGVINADDWASAENRNPIGGVAGSMYIVPANMTTPEALEKLAADPPAKPAEGTASAGNGKEPGKEPQTQPTPEEEKAQKAAKKEQAAVIRPIFRDAIGRILHRAAKGRNQAFVQSTIMPTLMVLAGQLQASPASSFLVQHCAALTLRAQAWTEDQAEAITDSEFAAAIESLLS